MALRRAVEGDDAPPEKRILQQERHSGGIAPAAEGLEHVDADLPQPLTVPAGRATSSRYSRTVKEIHMTA